MTKPTLLLIIDNLKRGGAETLLIGILKSLSLQYEVILVTLTDASDFTDAEIICQKRYVLKFKGKFSLVTCIHQLKKIIKNTNPILIHSHLFYSSLIARMACPSHIPLVYSIHSELSKNVFLHNPIYKLFEKFTIRKNHFLIAVSQTILNDYLKEITFSNKVFILNNYISDEYINQIKSIRQYSNNSQLRLVAVGNLKSAKNYEYLIHSMNLLKDYPVSLDIYGNTEYQFFSELSRIVNENQLNVNFKGKTDCTPQLFSSYDVFVMTSSNEGFGIAAVEAMSSGLPLLLSDIPVLREITFGNALFFDLSNPMALKDKIVEIQTGNHNLDTLSENGIEISKKYSKETFLKTLSSIYVDVLNSQKNTFKN